MSEGLRQSYDASPALLEFFTLMPGWHVANNAQRDRAQMICVLHSAAGPEALTPAEIMYKILEATIVGNLQLQHATLMLESIEHGQAKRDRQVEHPYCSVPAHSHCLYSLRMRTLYCLCACCLRRDKAGLLLLQQSSNLTTALVFRRRQALLLASASTRSLKTRFW